MIYVQITVFILLVPVPLTMLLALLLTISWFDPLRYWADYRWYNIKEAERRYKRYRLQFWLPALFFILILCIAIVLTVFFWGDGQSVLDRPIMLVLIGIPVVLLIPTVYGCRWVTREVERRFKEAISSPHCKNCGFNLRGNLDATTCPECGTPVPIGMCKKNDTTYHPGQGPAGHDRG